MSITMYQASIPVLVRALNNLSAVLAKGAAHATERSIAPEVLLNIRITPDMFPMIRQVQIATDIAKGAGFRLAALDPPKIDDTETTFDELQARIAHVIDLLSSLKPEQIDGSETRDITIKTRTGEVHFTGQDYLFGFVLPNIYFHSATAYAILRGVGVVLGKSDFLGRP